MLNMCHIRKKNDLDHLHCDLDHVCKLGVGREEETKDVLLWARKSIWTEHLQQKLRLGLAFWLLRPWAHGAPTAVLLDWMDVPRAHIARGLLAGERVQKLDCSYYCFVFAFTSATGCFSKYTISKYTRYIVGVRTHLVQR